MGSTPTPGTLRKQNFFPPVAQLVEQTPLKRTVVGSIPTGRITEAGVAKLADAPALGAGARKGMEVQVLSPAQI